MQEHLKWQDRSFLIEIKPRGEVASIFVDCPLSSTNSFIDEPTELVKVGNQSLVIIANWTDGKLILNLLYIFIFRKHC